MILSEEARKKHNVNVEHEWEFWNLYIYAVISPWSSYKNAYNVHSLYFVCIFFSYFGARVEGADWETNKLNSCRFSMRNNWPNKYLASVISLSFYIFIYIDRLHWQRQQFMATKPLHRQLVNLLVLIVSPFFVICIETLDILTVVSANSW